MKTSKGLKRAWKRANRGKYALGIPLSLKQWVRWLADGAWKYGHGDASLWLERKR